MAKFNTVQKNSTKTVSYEGGQVYLKSLEDEWSNMLFSCMLSSGFYETSDSVQSRYVDLTREMINKRGPQFVAKAACFSRKVLGLRSISELTAAVLNECQFEGKRLFYANYFKRPDGIGEVFSAVKALGGKRSHALIRGAKDYLETLNAYQVGKYQMSKHEFNLHDIINLTHAYSTILDRYQNGQLETPDTWEVRISTASPEEKELEWKRLVEERKLGYLALIRNLRNICKCQFATEDWCKSVLYEQITDEVSIVNSLVFPYQIYVAWKNARGYLPIILELALSDAFKLATQNMPELSGKSAIILDVSGSMECSFTENSSLHVNEVCSVYAAAIYYKNPQNTTVIKFGNEAKVIEGLDQYKNIFELINALTLNDGVGHGTYMAEVFPKLTEYYDRFFLFSDMQIMDEDDSYIWGQWHHTNRKSVNKLYDEYTVKFGNNHFYSFDLGRYHTQAVSQNASVKYITALNDKVFTAIELNEREGVSLIDLIESYEI